MGQGMGLTLHWPLPPSIGRQRASRSGKVMSELAFGVTTQLDQLRQEGGWKPRAPLPHSLV